jgi:caa(3)-type oxidase subunit IV
MRSNTLSNAVSTKHGFIFSQLAVLALLAVAVTRLHFSGGLNNLLVLGIAFGMAALVLVQYMGLKWRDTYIFWIFVIPVVLFAILVVLLIPDVAHQPIPFLNGF